MNEQKKKPKLFSLRCFVYDFIRVTAVLPGLLWFRPKVIYENEAAKKKIRGGALLMSNHNGFYDPVYLMFAIWYRRQHFICNKKFFDTKAGPFFRAALCIPIDTENASLMSLKEINTHLSAGEVVSIFPEGQVNDGSGEMRQFKSGMVLMAMRAKVPIIPVYVCEHKPFYRRLRVVIGEAFDINEMFPSRPTMSEIEQLTTRLFHKESELKEIALRR